MPVPQWLAQHLIKSGHWDVNGVGRRARGMRCRTCREEILTGLDADRCAEAVQVDPVPLSALGEMVARLGGRGTYALRRSAEGFRLDYRDRWHIAGKPAGTPSARFDVYPAHQCHGPAMSGPLTAPSVLQPHLEENPADVIPF